MAEELTDKRLKALPKPAAGNQITYDNEVKGFGVRATSAGARAFIVNYRIGGRERRITIGSFPDWKVSQARDEAKRIKRQVDSGEDPMAERHADRAAPTVDELAVRFEADHLSRRRASTVREYRSILQRHILPRLGKIKVADLRHSDIERLHREIAVTAPYQANRTVAVLSKMLNLAIKWELRSDNPARGIEREPEQKRERFLTPAEIAKLGEALASHPERTSCNAIRLLLLTGARRGEMLSSTWNQFNLEKGVWLKPGAATKQTTDHRVPLSAAALEILAAMKTAANPGCPWVFPGQPTKHGTGPLREIKRAWLAVCVKAGLAEQVQERVAGKPVKDAAGKPLMVWKTTVRVHDLRHTYASILASSNLSLPIIGALLGHTQAATTQRYAHLLDDPLRAATECVGAFVAGAGNARAEVGPKAGRREHQR